SREGFSKSASSLITLTAYPRSMNSGGTGGNGSSRTEEPWVRIEPAHSWKDVVLPAQTQSELQAISDNFRRRSHGSGLQYLFLGERGTGKTMATLVIGTELGQPIFEVDLGAELRGDGERPEQLVERVFAAAESARAIVLFDGVG